MMSDLDNKRLHGPDIDVTKVETKEEVHEEASEKKETLDETVTSLEDQKTMELATLTPERATRDFRPFSYEQKKGTSWKRMLAAFLAGAVMLGGWGFALGDGLQSWVSSGEQVAGEAFSTNGSAQNVNYDASVVRPNTIASMVKEAGPAVVKITTYMDRASGSSSNPLMADPFFRQFFGHRLPDDPRMNEGLGTGFIISKDGYVVTNEHVVDGADRIEVSVEGYDKPLPAKLIGEDHQLDLAVLKIEGGSSFPTLNMGDSDSVQVGDWVVAIGNPYGYDHTVTVGVVSAKGRPVDVEDRQYRDLLQTDASINPGNSGGPLLNLKGEVVGINTAVSAQAQGIGFAIPTKTVQGVLQQLIEDGKVIRPWLGVSIQNLTPEIIDYFGLDIKEGAIVAQTAPNSPAAAAGLRQGDVILELNGSRVKSAEDLIQQIKALEVGVKAMLLIERQGEQQFVSITIGERPAEVK